MSDELTADRIRAYLAGTGWTLGPIGAGAALWQRHGGSIRLPHEMTDWDLGKAVMDIGIAEDRHPGDVHADVLAYDGPAVGGPVRSVPPPLEPGCIFMLPPRSPLAHVLVDTLLRVTGLTPREAGALLHVSASAVNAWSTGAAINTAHYERLADLNRRAQQVPSKMFYGRRDEIFAPRGGQPSIYDEWLADAWTPPLDQGGAPAQFAAPEQQSGRVEIRLRRRTPDEARAWLLEHRDKYIAQGIPAEILDRMIEDTYQQEQQ